MILTVSGMLLFQAPADTRIVSYVFRCQKEKTAEKNIAMYLPRKGEKMNGISLLLSRIRMNVFYAKKTFWSIALGYAGLQFKNNLGDWENVDWHHLRDDPHYVCALFYNGRHIPLPFFTNPDEVDWLQKKAIDLARAINPRSYQAVEIDCAWYQHLWDEESVDDQSEEAEDYGQETDDDYEPQRVWYTEGPCGHNGYE